MSCPIKRKIINKKKEDKQREEREKRTKQYSDVTKETQIKRTPTHLISDLEKRYIITTCIIHERSVNLGKHELIPRN